MRTKRKAETTMAPKTAKRKDTTVTKRTVGFIAALVALNLAIFTFYHVIYAQRIIPGAKVGNSYVGGLTPVQAKVLLKDKKRGESHKILLKHDDHEYTLSLAEINFEYDLDATTEKALQVGRSGNFLVDSYNKIYGFIAPIQIDPIYSYDKVKLTNFLNQISSDLNVEKIDAHFELEGGVLMSVNHADGIEVDVFTLKANILRDFSGMHEISQQIPLQNAPAEVTEKDLDKYKNEISAFLDRSIRLESPAGTWWVPSEQLLDFIKITKDGYELNEVGVENYLNSFASQINILPRGKVEVDDDGNVLLFKITEKGKELDREKFKRDLASAIFDGSSLNLEKNPDSAVVIELKLTEMSLPKVTEGFGIKELLGEGNSKFYGSIPSRITNLSLAAERANGVIVPPGEVFSFNSAVGEISGATGYDSAYIISNGRTVLGEGGGVCQTSTTLFRAMLNSGLEIIERFPHAYRVSYYEYDEPVGLDASIYQPSLDLKFRNDTENYVLVTSSVDVSTSSMNFKIYGTSDGRKVEISKPQVYNISPPPEPLYEEDPNLPKGVTEQVDYAAWGATSSFSRIVTNDGVTLHEDTFTSNYRPWQAVFKVGTRE